MRHYLQSFLLGVTVGIGLSSIGSIAAYAACRPEAKAVDLPAASDGLVPAIQCRRHRRPAATRGDDDGRLVEFLRVR